jgi:hypothetical protein
MSSLSHESSQQASDRQMGASASQDAAASNCSGWTPLHVPLFRAFWMATLFANIGALMQQSGAARAMTDLSSSPLWSRLCRWQAVFQSFC